jgi:hypothetical protein
VIVDIELMERKRHITPREGNKDVSRVKSVIRMRRVRRVSRVTRVSR